MWNNGLLGYLFFGCDFTYFWGSGSIIIAEGTSNRPQHHIQDSLGHCIIQTKTRIGDLIATGPCRPYMRLPKIGGGGCP